MNRFRYFVIMGFLLFALSLSTSSCRSGYGCESTEKIRKDQEKGLESSKRGKSSLFSKKQRKKMKQGSSK